MLAVDAVFHIQGTGGKRSVKAEDFFQGLYMTDMHENEMITAIEIPVPDAHTKGAYVKFMQPASRFAIVGVAAVMTRSNGKCENVKIAMNGASASTFRDKDVEAALEGNDFSEASIEAAANKAAESVSIMSDHFASEGYRKHLAKVYTKRALMALN
jgi:carbon-monoxide dehydrogenase medium subunit